METPIDTGRDPVCEAIESLLNDLQIEGKGQFTRIDKQDIVLLSFGALRVEANTYDIALVRLASAMMDDPAYAPLIMETLRGHAGAFSGA